jgi:hypothetical protein
MTVSRILLAVFPLILFWVGMTSQQFYIEGDSYLGNQLLSMAILGGGLYALFIDTRNEAQEDDAAVLKQELQESHDRNLFLDCELRAAFMEKYAKPVSIHVATPNAGYVYLLKEINGVHYKIGRASNPQDRLRTFNVKLPYQVEYVCLIPTIDMYSLERHLHRQYTEKRVNGEWFALSDEDVASIIALAQEAEG